jgi:fructose-1,6-bisphosphatase II
MEQDRLATVVLGAEHYPPELVAALREATEAAAEASRRWLGKGDKFSADGAAVAAMRASLLTAPFRGTVVIGEGEKDEAPMLANGEVLGSGVGPECDVAVDPLDGTRLVAEGIPGSICVLALAPRGSMLAATDVFYMEKLIAGQGGVGVLDLTATPTENVRALAAALGKPVSELAVAVLDKPRHRQLIAELRDAGVRLELRGEGDISAAVEAASPGGDIDLVMGVGGTPEGVVTACAMRAVGGFLQARLAPQTPEERQRALAAGHDLARVLSADDLVRSPRVLFVSTRVS